MKKIGTGYFYNVFQKTSTRVLKKQKNFLDITRDEKIKNIPAVLRQNKIVKKNTEIIKNKLKNKILAKQLGNPNFVSRFNYEQDRALLLMDYFDTHSLDQNKQAIDAYLDLTLELLDFGIHDYVYKFKNSYGFNSKGDLLFIDFNEVVFSKKEILDYVSRKHWLQEAQYRKFSEGPLKKYIFEQFEARLNTAVVEERFESQLEN